jgi:hypothetical protein
LNEEYERVLSQCVVEPLERVLGTTLQRVVYYVMQCDYDDFDVDAPNASGGCQGVHLIFSDGEVEFDWDWEQIFLPLPEDVVSPGIGFHLVVRPLSERAASVRIPIDYDDVSGTRAMEATHAVPWKAIHREALQYVTVGGALLADGRISPQAVRLSFPSAQVVVTLGMSDPPGIGDGNEILILTEPEWPLKLSDWKVPIVNIWSSGRSV